MRSVLASGRRAGFFGDGREVRDPEESFLNGGGPASRKSGVIWRTLGGKRVIRLVSSL